jgi:hypothetical protein
MVVPQAAWREVGGVPSRHGPDLRDARSGGAGNFQFDDVPEELNRWVLNAPKETRDDPFAFGHMAGQAVIAFYLRKLLDRKNPFLDYPENQAERIPWQQTIRLTQIAQALFTLRREPGFPEICRPLSIL